MKNSILQKADAASIGLEMGGFVIAGYLIGQWLDSLFGTTPWLMYLYLILGIYAAFRVVYRVAMKWQRTLRREAKVLDAPRARTLVSGRWSEGVR